MREPRKYIKLTRDKGYYSDPENLNGKTIEKIIYPRGEEEMTIFFTDNSVIKFKVHAEYDNEGDLCKSMNAVSESNLTLEEKIQLDIIDNETYDILKQKKEAEEKIAKIKKEEAERIKKERERAQREEEYKKLKAEFEGSK